MARRPGRKCDVGGRKSDVDGRKCHVVGRKGYVVVRRHRFVALLDETSDHLVRIGVRDDHSGAQHVCIAVYRERSDAQKLLPGVWGHSQEGRKYPIDAWKNSFPAHGNKRKDHQYHFSVRIILVPVRRNRVVARHTAQVVRRHHVGVRENSKKIFLCNYVHVHANACTERLDFVT